MDAGNNFRNPPSQGPQAGMLNQLTPMRILRVLFLVLIFLYVYMFVSEMFAMILGPPKAHAHALSLPAPPPPPPPATAAVRLISSLERIEANVSRLQEQVKGLGDQMQVAGNAEAPPRAGRLVELLADALASRFHLPQTRDTVRLTAMQSLTEVAERYESMARME
jgi:hypothetical protein